MLTILYVFLSLLPAHLSKHRSGFSSFPSFYSDGREGGHFAAGPRYGQRTGHSDWNSLDADCALAIPGLDYCITYSAVDSAFDRARDTIYKDSLRVRPGKSLEINAMSDLAEVIEETSRILAKVYRMNKQLVFDYMASIDTYRTVIKNYCPPNLQRRSCELSRYREIQGTCNNLEHPYWGSAVLSFSRFLPNAYADGINSPRISISGRDLPSPRLVSHNMHRDVRVHEHSINIFLIAWGQFIDHDVTLTAETEDLQCCKGPNVTHPFCLPIQIPENDGFYSHYGQGCINFARSRAGLRTGCRLGPRVQINTVSSLLDANTVYSNDPEKIRKLRTHEGGRMRTLPAFREHHGLKDLLPLNLEHPDKGCIRPSKNVFCFIAGDSRVSEQTVLTVIHTIFVREHNRIAEELQHINPHWDDETLFQEARHVVAAVMQHITINEFLPLVLGKTGLHEHNLTPYVNGYYDGYSKKINPTASSAFTTAAFRFGHSLLPSTIERWSRSHRYAGTQKLAGMLLQPYDLFKAGWADQYILGMLNQVAQAMDDSVTDQVTNHLFEKPGKGFGMDLASLNIQRGREHGVPSYNRFREWCGLKPLLLWSELTGVMHNTSTASYPKIYDSPEDIDLWSGGVSELSKDGALVGPTFTCIIGRQFSNLRAGDRFWYENSGWPSSFTVEQLEEIRKASLARLVCDNGDALETVQLRAMLLPDHKLNPRVPCGSQQIPRVDLEPWREAPPFRV